MLEAPTIPESAPFSHEQRLWLNGFLAGYFARKPSPQTTPERTSPSTVGKPLRICYGSQTGTAQALANRFAAYATKRGFNAQVTDLADYSKLQWTSESNVCLVTSTYGEGEMPDNAQAFWNWLGSDNIGSCQHLRFSVLALGDRNYAEFCAAGKKLDLRLEELGAHRIFPRSDCDVDYEAVAQVWMEGVLCAFSGQTTPSPGEASQPPLVSLAAKVNSDNPILAKENHGKTNPFRAPLLKNLRLTRPGSAKEVRHYELSLNGSGLVYEAGDALGVVPTNCPGLVDELLAFLNWRGDEVVCIGENQVPVREAFLRLLDITKASPDLLAAVALKAPSSVLPGLLDPGKRDQLKQWLWGKGVIDVLQLLNQPMAPQELVKLLKRLSPRLYSIASSPKAHPNEVHLTVNTVRYESAGRQRKGVASTFLADRVGDQEHVKVFVQPSHGFRPPSNSDVSMIMVGPGTGIAPFRAFLEEREAVGAKGRHWLFFGDQKRETDFLYEEQLNGWCRSGHLCHLDVAFSRDQAEKVYVQHRMLDRAKEIWSWLQDGAFFYVCGDASRMAKDVDGALHQIASSAGGLSEDDAKSWVATLRDQKRYRRDVY